MSTANVIWLDSWVEIMTVKWSSSGPFCEAKRIPDWFKLWFFLALSVCVCVCSGSYVWFWSLYLVALVSHAKVLGPLFSCQMRCAKFICEPSVAKAKRRGGLLRTWASVNTPEAPNLKVPKRINCGTLQMRRKGEERQTAEQLKMWPSSDHRSPIKLMVWDLTVAGGAWGCAISHLETA